MDEQPARASRSTDHDSADAGRKLEQVDKALDHLGQLCARLEQAEQRFKQMTDECGCVLEGLVAVDRRHAITLATLNDRLGDWCSIERKLLEESASRIERFERGVEREWTVLRRLHEEPITDLRDQADKLRVACLDAARLVSERLDAADHDRLLQTVNLERRLAEWTERVMQATTVGVRGAEPGTEIATQFEAEFGQHAAPAVDPWPLDGVAQLHQEMRTRPPAPRPRYIPAGLAGDDAQGNAGPGGSPPAPAEAIGAAAPGPVSLPSRTPNPGRAWIVWSALAVVASMAGIVLVIYVSQTQRRLVDLESKTLEAARQVKASQAVAPRVTDAQESAERAGAMAEILAAPDLVRFALAGAGPGQGSYGQVLWSRSRGMALTAVGLHPTAGTIYRVWVIDNTRTAAAGNLTVNGAGTGRLIVSGPLTLPRPATIAVTLENDGSGDRPAGPTCLARTPAS